MEQDSRLFILFSLRIRFRLSNLSIHLVRFRPKYGWVSAVEDEYFGE